MNGQGYPDGLKNGEIPVGGRMLALADVFDALTSRRQYRDREPIEKVWGIIEQEAGQTFDSQIVKEFRKIRLNRIIEILEYDQKNFVDNQDLIKLAPYTLSEILKIKGTPRNKLTDKQRRLEKIFDKYYLRKYHQS
jgi:hypothetical protein